MVTYHDVSQTESKGPAELAVSITFLVLTWLSVGMRCWVRARIIHGFGWDDALMAMALLSYTVYACALIVIVLVYGGGTHIEVAASAMRWILLDEVFYILTTWVLKLSLGVFFLRIIIRPWQRYMVYATMVISTLTSLFFFFFIIFMCGNPGDYLIRYVTGQCAPHDVQLALTYTHACINLVMDWMFAVLPIQIVLQANMERRAKILVAFILSLGAVGSVCSTVRIRYVAGLVSTTDYFWNAAMIAIWSAVECGAGITAGSLATLRPLVKHWTAHIRLPSSFNSSFKRRSRSLPHSSKPGHAPSNNSQTPSYGTRPWHKLDCDSSLSSCGGSGNNQQQQQQKQQKQQPQQDIPMTDTPAPTRSRSVASQTAIETTEANRMTTIEEFETEDAWLTPRAPPSRCTEKSFETDLEAGWLIVAPGLVDVNTRRSSHALGEEEARRIRRALEEGVGPGVGSSWSE